jgi:hypothetical protein
MNKCVRCKPRFTQTPAAAFCFSDEVAHSVEKCPIRVALNPGSKVRFMEDNDSARANLFRCMHDCINWVRLKHQYVAPYNSVEMPACVEVNQFCINKLNIRTSAVIQTSLTSLLNDD